MSLATPDGNDSGCGINHRSFACNGRHICEPTAIPGEVVAERIRSRFAAAHGGEHYGEHYNDPGVTGSIKAKGAPHPLRYSGEDDDHLPLAEPGED
jgi:hypothetical protein